MAFFFNTINNRTQIERGKLCNIKYLNLLVALTVTNVLAQVVETLPKKLGEKVMLPLNK
jgi:hypothetical protein